MNGLLGDAIVELALQRSEHESGVGSFSISGGEQLERLLREALAGDSQATDGAVRLVLRRGGTLGETEYHRFAILARGGHKGAAALVLPEAYQRKDTETARLLQYLAWTELPIHKVVYPFGAITRRYRWRKNEYFSREHPSPSQLDIEYYVEGRGWRKVKNISNRTRIFNDSSVLL